MTEQLPFNQAQMDLLRHTHSKTLNVWLVGGWVFIESDEMAIGRPPFPHHHPRAQLEAAKTYAERRGFIIHHMPGWFGSDPRVVAGELEIAHIRDVAGKLASAAGGVTFGRDREYEFTPDAVLCTNRRTLALRHVQTGLTRRVRMPLSAWEMMSASQAERLLIRVGRHSVAWIDQHVAYVCATAMMQPGLSDSISFLEQDLGPQSSMKRVDFGRAMRAIEPDHQGRRLMPAGFTVERPFAVEYVSDAYATMSGPIISWRVSPTVLMLSDTPGTHAYIGALPT